MGNCGNISAIWKGFVELEGAGLIREKPRMFGVQAAGAAPVVEMLRKNLERLSPVKTPETVATAIRIGNPVNWPKAVNAIRNSSGLYDSVTDDEIVETQKMIACLEGIGVEPASAASVAGVRKAVLSGSIPRDAEVACVCTGHLLKDPEEVISVCGKPIEIPPDLKAVTEMIRPDQSAPLPTRRAD